MRHNRDPWPNNGACLLISPVRACRKLANKVRIPGDELAAVTQAWDW